MKWALITKKKKNYQKIFRSLSIAGANSKVKKEINYFIYYSILLNRTYNRRNKKKGGSKKCTTPPRVGHHSLKQQQKQRNSEGVSLCASVQAYKNKIKKKNKIFFFCHQLTGSSSLQFLKKIYFQKKEKKGGVNMR